MLGMSDAVVCRVVTWQFRQRRRLLRQWTVQRDVDAGNWDWVASRADMSPTASANNTSLHLLTPQLNMYTNTWDTSSHSSMRSTGKVWLPVSVL